MNMKEYAISYYDMEVGRWLTQVIGTNNLDETIKHFKRAHDRVKVEERPHWWYNNGSN